MTKILDRWLLESEDRTYDATDTMIDVPRRWNLDVVVEELRHSRDITHNVRHLKRLRAAPSRAAIVDALHDLAAALFPAHFGQPGLTLDTIDTFVATTLDRALTGLHEQVRRSLPFSTIENETEETFAQKADDITRGFVKRLPDVRNLLVSDLQAAFAGDPAATGYSELLLVYPGITALIHHRLAHELRELGASFLARLISDIARSKTGIDIHPVATIGRSFFIDHGTGVVIGETAIIGERVRLYQAVTLGARSFPTDENGALIKVQARHPIIGDDVVIYAGSTVLGRITVGHGSTIGGNVWLTQSVPPYSNVNQAHVRSAKNDGDFVNVPSTPISL